MFITEQEDNVTSVEQSWLRCSWVVDVDAITEAFTGITDEAGGVFFAKEYLVNVSGKFFSDASTLPFIDAVGDRKAFNLSDNVVVITLLPNDSDTGFVTISGSALVDVDVVSAKGFEFCSFCCCLSCFCMSQLHRTHKGGGSEISVVGVGGITSIIAGGGGGDGNGGASV